MVAQRFLLKLLDHLPLVRYYLLVLCPLLVGFVVFAKLPELFLVLRDVEFALRDFLDDLRVVFLGLKAGFL